MNPGPGVGVVEQFGLGEVATVSIDPTIVDDQGVVPMDSNWCFMLVISHDIEFPSIRVSKPAFSVGRCGAGAPSFHSPVITSELGVFGATSWGLEDRVPGISVANVRLRRGVCPGLKYIGANRPFKRVKQRALKPPELIEGVEVGRRDPSHNFGDCHPDPLTEMHVDMISHSAAKSLRVPGRAIVASLELLLWCDSSLMKDWKGLSGVENIDRLLKQRGRGFKETILI